MATKIQEVMTRQPVTLAVTTPVAEGARRMRDEDIGDVLVLDDSNEICGIVTDRDIAVRVVADGKDPEKVKLGDICSRELVTLSPDDSVSDAVKLMSKKAIRRVPVVDGGRPVGIVSIGDLAVDRDPESALADISAAAPNK